MKLILLIIVLIPSILCAESALQRIQMRHQLDSILKANDATVGLALRNIESAEEYNINGDKLMTTMSVYKFQIALYLLHLVDKHQCSLSELIHVAKNDWMKETHSPLGERCHNAAVDLRLDTLLTAMVGESDNNATDIILRHVGGASKVQAFVRSLGLQKTFIATTEHQMHHGQKAVLANRCSALDAVKALELWHTTKVLSPEMTAWLKDIMLHSKNAANRFLAGLPPGTEVAHKTGTSGFYHDRLTACNDIGVITLANGQHLCLAIFVGDAKLSYEGSAALIADLSRVIWNNLNNANGH